MLALMWIVAESIEIFCDRGHIIVMINDFFEGSDYNLSGKSMLCMSSITG